MHYCIHVFTHGCPTNGQLERILSPYDGSKLNDDEYPAFTWDYWRLGGRYGGGLKLKIDSSRSIYEWSYIPREERNNRLFKSSLLDQVNKNGSICGAWSESGWLNHLGYNDGYIRVDGAYVCDILNRDELGCWAYVINTGDFPNYVAVREHWNGKEWKRNPDFDELHKDILEKTAADPEMFLTVVDIHD